MTTIYGVLGIEDTSRVMLNTMGERVVFDAVQQVLAEHNADVQAALSVFVDETTDAYKSRYILPGGGKMQRLGPVPQGPAATVKATGYWDVALPLEEYGDAIGAPRVVWAYMTAQDLARHIATIQARNLNTIRFELLKALLNNAQDTFVDPLHGSLLIEPLANGDAVIYPPVLASETEATEDHYLESNYTAANISDTNDPFVTIAADTKHHFGNPTGGGSLVAFINSAQTAKTTALSAFSEVPDRFIELGATVSRPANLPANLPGRIIGRHTDAGVWVVEWDFVPANYILGMDLDAPKPLLQRVDPVDTGLARGLTLVAESDVYPFTMSHYSHRFGFGAGNRLNGVVLELGTGGTYTVPTAYA